MISLAHGTFWVRELSSSRNFVLNECGSQRPPNKHSYLGMMQAEAFPKAAEF
jgi:hypothetical protein